MITLTPGAIQAILNGQETGPFYLQVRAIKTITSDHSSSVKYKLLLSDGVYATVCVLSSQLTHLITNDQIVEGSLVLMRECTKGVSNTKQIIIILNMEVLQKVCPLIGNSTTLPREHARNGSVMAPAAVAANGMPPQQPQIQQFAPYGGQYGAPPLVNPYAPPPAAAAAAAPVTPGPAIRNPYASPLMRQNGGDMQHPQPVSGMSGPGAALAAGGSNAGGLATRPPQQQQRTSHSHQNFTPIHALNPYQDGRTIKARVTQKSDIRRYSNARGEGRFFSFDLLDADGGEIRAVGWNDQCDRCFNQVAAGQVYIISKVSVKPKRGNFNQTRHQYEIILQSSTQIHPVHDEVDIPKIDFNFVPIKRIEDTPANTTVDVIAVVESVAGSVEITRRDRTQALKRSITIRDDSDYSIELTLWGNYTTNPGDQLEMEAANNKHPVIAVKSARVGEFNGRTLSTISATTILINPQDIPRAEALRSWYDSGGGSTAALQLSTRTGGGGRQDRRVCVAQYKGEGLGLGGQPAYVQTVGFLNFVKRNPFCYPACPLQYNGKQCMKKLVDQTGDGGSWHCEQCNADVVPDYRYVLEVQLDDQTGGQSVTAFNQCGPLLLNVSAAQMKEWKENDPGRFEAAMTEHVTTEYVVKVKLAEESFNDAVRLKGSLLEIERIDFVSETRWSLNAIARLEAGGEAFPAVMPAMPTGLAEGGYDAQPTPQQQQGGWGAPQAGGGQCH